MPSKSTTGQIQHFASSWHTNTGSAEALRDILQIHGIPAVLTLTLGLIVLSSVWETFPAYAMYGTKLVGTNRFRPLFFINNVVQECNKLLSSLVWCSTTG